jgi:hypothetical protein
MSHAADERPPALGVRAAGGVLLLLALGGGLALSGGFALYLSAAGQFLPHDVAFLGMGRDRLCAAHGCRVVHFMIHDRASFGGVVAADGLLYLWPAASPLRRGRAWAWRALAVSGAAGFLGFLAHLPSGYLDAWHGAATLALLPCFAGGLLWSRPAARPGRTPARMRWSSPLMIGKVFLTTTSAGLAAGGLTILAVGATCVFVPQDVAYMGLSADDLRALNPRLVPLIAHDRVGFGGALCSYGLALLYGAWRGEPAPWWWLALAASGAAAFAPALAVHVAVGYVDAVHLAPAVFGAVLFLTGLVLTAPASFRRGPT